MLFSQEERKACLAKALLTLSRSAAVDRTLHFELFQFPCTSSLRQPAQVHRGERSAKSHGGKCLGDEQCAHRLLQSVRLLDIISSLFVAPRRPRGTTSPALCARTVRRGRGVKRVVVGDGGRGYSYSSISTSPGSRQRQAWTGPCRNRTKTRRKRKGRNGKSSHWQRN